MQSSQPDVPLRLARVGIRNLVTRVDIHGKAGVLPLFPSLDLFVDLPGSRRGVHVSRDPESLYDVLDSVQAEAPSVEGFCEALARRLLERHNYARRAEARLRGKIVLARSPPGAEATNHEPYDILASATATRSDEGAVSITRLVGARVVGFTACPCAQGLLEAAARQRLGKLGYGERAVGDILERVAVATHTQRAIGTVLVTALEGFQVDFEDLVRLLEDAMSGRTYTLLKRPYEAKVLEEAVKRPRFIEDVVRGVLIGLAKEYEGFPDGTRVYVHALSKESIHKHDITAERATTLGEIRREIEEADQAPMEG